jgi:formate hydrogenlyase subunit 3/multisubunit Na+/H+ antiporter MnhD subunit
MTVSMMDNIKTGFSVSLGWILANSLIFGIAAIFLGIGFYLYNKEKQKEKKKEEHSQSLKVVGMVLMGIGVLVGISFFGKFIGLWVIQNFLSE